jgi:glycine/D-amino acid oxidase-like deaminating enzyme
MYTVTPDEHFIMDRHPRAANAWLLGGGSGHGYKHGPAVGERMAAHLLDGCAVEPLFAVKRLVS